MPTLTNQLIREKNRKSGKILKKSPIWLYPMAIETKYTSLLLELTNKIKEAVNNNIIVNLKNLVDEAGLVKNDAFPDEIDRLIDNTRLEVGSNIVNQRSTLMSLGTNTSNWNLNQWRKVMQGVVGIQLYQQEPWLRDQLSSWTKENSALILDLQERTYQEVEGIVQRGVSQGKRHEGIAEDILRETSLPGRPKGPLAKIDNRAKLIARDQVSKLNARMTQLRQTGVGIEKYIWRTSIDERVRESHKEKEGKKYSWNKPPVDTGHPGEDYQCRCWAEADFSTIFEEAA